MVDSKKNLKKAISKVSVFAMSCLMFLMGVPLAFGANTNGNTAYVNANTDANVSNQTIVGEGANNNVIITNTAQGAPDPTGILAANMPYIVVGAIILTIALIIFLRTKRDRDEL